MKSNGAPLIRLVMPAGPADVGQLAGQLERVDEFGAGPQATLDAEGQHGAVAVLAEVLEGALVERVGGQAGVYWRNLNLKPKFESSPSHLSINGLVPGGFNLGLIGSTCTALPG